jgi:CxxC motif-containing protein
MEAKKYDNDEAAVLYNETSKKGFKYFTGFVKEDLKKGDRIVMFPLTQANDSEPAFVVKKSKPMAKQGMTEEQKKQLPEIEEL